MNAFRNQYGGISYINVGVEVPNIGETNMGSPSVQSIEIQYEKVVREIMQIEVMSYKKNEKFIIVVESKNPVTGYK